MLAYGVLEFGDVSDCHPTLSLWSCLTMTCVPAMESKSVKIIAHGEVCSLLCAFGN